MAKKEQFQKFRKWSRGKPQYKVNENFFNVWSSQMAYILGFTFADGNIHKYTLAWDLQKKDLELLEKFKLALNCTNPITLHRERSYRLRISNLKLINGAIARGLLPKKNIRNTVPSIPKSLVRHFVRGYIDGDGWIVIRQHRNEIDVGCAGGNKDFLLVLNNILSEKLNIKPGQVREKIKLTPKAAKSTTYQLEFYSSNAAKIINWAYGDLETKDLYLSRKYKKYLQARELDIYLKSGSKGERIVQSKYGKPIKDLLEELFVKQGLDGVQTAEILGVHSSSIYRWLAKTGIRYPISRIKHV